MAVMMSRHSCLLACLALAAAPLLAQQPADGPKILLAHPLAVKAGETVKVKLRGRKLDSTTEVTTAAANVTIKVLNKGAAEVPQKLVAEAVGNSQVEIELTLPADLPAGMLPLVAKTGGGDTTPFELFIGGPHPVVAEKEGNDGFRQAQEVKLPVCIDGAMQNAQDVDVFVFDVPAGKTLKAELFAARHGSALDGILSLYDSETRVLVRCDDVGESHDPKIEFKVPAAGRYYLALQDAFDYGGPLHPYRLVITAD
jgi:hypothetical protein